MNEESPIDRHFNCGSLWKTHSGLLLSRASSVGLREKHALPIPTTLRYLRLLQWNEETKWQELEPMRISWRNLYSSSDSVSNSGWLHVLSSTTNVLIWSSWFVEGAAVIVIASFCSASLAGMNHP